jgi:PAS domain S-box-containing protein
MPAKKSAKKTASRRKSATKPASKSASRSEEAAAAKETDGKKVPSKKKAAGPAATDKAGDTAKVAAKTTAAQPAKKATTKAVDDSTKKTSGAATPAKRSHSTKPASSTRTKSPVGGMQGDKNSGDDAKALRKELDKLRKAHERLEATQWTLKSSRDELAAQNSELLARNTQLNNTVTEFEKNNARLESLGDRTDKDLEKLKRENADLVEQVKALMATEGQLTQLAKEKATTDQTLEETRAELASTRKELTGTLKEVERHAKKIEKSQEQLDKTRQNATEKNKAVSETRKELEKQESIAKALQEAAEQQAAELSARDSELESRTTELQRLQQEIQSVRGELEATRERLAEANREATARGETLTSQEKGLESTTRELEGVRARLDEMRAEYESLQTTTKSLQTAHDNLARKLLESQDLCELVQQENSDLTEAKKQLESSLCNLESKRDSLQENLADVKRQNDHLTRANEGLMTTNEELATANRAAIESHQKLTAANDELAMSCEALEDTNEDLVEEIKKITVKHSDLSDKRQELEDEIRDLTREKDSIDATRDDYQNQAADLGERVREIGVELQEAKIETDEYRRREENLRSDVAASQKLVDVAGSNIVVVNKNHKLTLVNQEACELLGQSETELLGQDWFDEFVPQPIRAEKIALFSEILAGDLDPRSGFEHVVLTRRGERVVKWRIALLEDETGASAGALFTGEDVTERRTTDREVRREKDRVTRLADAFPVLISYIDAEQKYQFVNAACEEWLEARKEDLLGKDLRSIVGDPAYEVLRGYVENVLSGWQVSFDKEIVYRNGKKRYIQAIYVPHFGTGDKVLGYYELVTDITERKDAEIEFRNQTERLQAQLKIKSEEAHGAQEKAARESRQRREIERQLDETREVLQGILSNRSITLSRIDENGIFTRSVGSGLSSVGLKDDQLVGVNAFEVYPDLRDMLRQALRGEEVQFIDEGTLRDGRTQEERSIYLQNYLFPDRVAGKGMFCLSIDITGFVEPSDVE